MRNYLKCTRPEARAQFFFFEDSKPREREQIREIAVAFLNGSPDGLASLWRTTTTLSDLHVIGVSTERADMPTAAAKLCINCDAPLGLGRRYYERFEGALAHIACS